MKRSFLIFCLALLGTVFMLVAEHSVNLDLCSAADLGCRESWNYFEKSFKFFPFLLFFSLLMIFLPRSVFTKWFKFSCISAPIILALSLLINLELHHQHGGFFNTSNMLDVPLLTTSYVFYVIGSIVAIYRGYKQSKLTGASSEKRVDVRRVN